MIIEYIVRTWIVMSEQNPDSGRYSRRLACASNIVCLNVKEAIAVKKALDKIPQREQEVLARIPLPMKGHLYVPPSMLEQVAQTMSQAAQDYEDGDFDSTDTSKATITFKKA